MSTVKVNTVDKRTGSTLTLGGCGTTVTLGAGATQSGFGRTGTVDWCTTAKTAPFTGVSGKGYFVNTSCGAVTVTLPASPSAGDIVSLADYASNWCGNNVTICNNGSKLNGTCCTAKLNTAGQSVTLIYVDATRGWKTVQDSTADITGGAYITATGGTITTCGNYKVHTFTADGCFSVSDGSGPLATVDYLVVAGGGSGGGFIGGGAGAGGFRVSNSWADISPSLMSPLTSSTGVPVSIQTYPITVGGGAAFADGSTYCGRKGSNSVFSTITSAGGGGGGYFPAGPSPLGGTGGSGGGSDYNCSPPASPSGFAAGNTPPVSPPQGNPGGYAVSWPGAAQAAPGGGGGAGAAGGPSTATATIGNGGIGSYVAPSFAGTNGTTGPVPGVRYFAGGGGGGGYTTSACGTGGAGGGGKGATSPNNPPTLSGVANTGGGGGGQGGYPSPGPTGGAGGSGIVIIRYKYQ
jgi:hypothetical protein